MNASKDSKPGWTREPMPSPQVLHPEWYFIVELHKGEWLVSLESSYQSQFKANVPYWMRWSEPVVFPEPPE